MVVDDFGGGFEIDFEVGGQSIVDFGQVFVVWGVDESCGIFFLFLFKYVVYGVYDFDVVVDGGVVVCCDYDIDGLGVEFVVVEGSEQVDMIGYVFEEVGFYVEVSGVIFVVLGYNWVFC